MSHLLEVKNLATHFPTREGLVRAVDGVSFHLDRSELLGLVGESGCGKSMTALSVMQLVAPPGKIESSGGYFIDHKPERPEEFTHAPFAMKNIVAPGTFAALLFQLTRVARVWGEIVRGFVNRHRVSLRISPKFSGLSRFK